MRFDRIYSGNIYFPFSGPIRADRILFIYDISNEKSFEPLHTLIELYSRSSYNIVVGNKCDNNRIREVSYEKGKELADKHGAYFIEISALTNYNVEESFEILLRSALSIT